MPAPRRERLRKAYIDARSHPADAQAVGRLGMLLQAFEQYELASRCYARASALQPGDFTWLFYSAQARAALGDKQEAIGSLQRALKIEPDYIPARLRLADLLLGTGQLSGAEENYRAVLERRPDSALAYYGLGRIHMSRSEWTKAAASLEKASSLSPEFGLAYYALGIVRRNQGRISEAEQFLSLFQAHRDTAPQVPDSLSDNIRDLARSANTWLTSGLRFLQEGRYPEAIRDFERALQNDPSLAEAHANLLSAYVEMGQFAKAKLHYDAAIASDPNCYQAYYNYGLSLSKQDKFEQAQTAFETALKINPFYAEAHNNLGFILAGAGKLDEAISHFQAAIHDRPDYQDARFNLAQLQLTQGKTETAIEQLELLIRSNGDQTPLYILTLAKAYLKQGDSERGLKYARQARERAALLNQTALVREAAGLLSIPGETRH